MKKLDSEIKTKKKTQKKKTTSKEEATYFSPRWMILDLTISVCFFFFFFFLRVHCSRARTGLLGSLYFLTMLDKCFVFCFERGKKP